MEIPSITEHNKRQRRMLQVRRFASIGFDINQRNFLIKENEI